MSEKWWKLPNELGAVVLERAKTGEGAPLLRAQYVRLRVPGRNGDLLVPESWLVRAEPPLPEELPEGSVVLDAAGDAWQRQSQSRDDQYRNWHCAVQPHPTATWKKLNDFDGPLRVVVTGRSRDES